jgi:hypothetical protein
MFAQNPRWWLGHSQRPHELHEPGICWDAGDTLGWGKAPGRAKSMALWTPRSWKVSPCHNLLKEQPAKSPTHRPVELLLCSAGLSAPQSIPGPRSTLDPCPTGIPETWATPGPSSMPHQDPCLLGHAGPQLCAGSLLCQDPCPSGPPPMRPCQAPAPHGMIRAMFHQDPCPLGPAGHQLHVRQPHPHSARFPTPWAALGPSFTGLPDNHSTRLLLRSPQEDSKPA